MKKIPEGYKETELGVIPQEWEVRKLEDVSTIIMGQSPLSESYNDDGNGVPFFQGKTEFGKINPVIRKWCTSPTKIAEPLDILMSVRAPVGDVNICNVQACIGRGLASIRQTKNSNYLFLFYVLQFLNKNINKSSQGSTFTAINGSDLKKTQVFVPSLPEQQKIAEILSSVDDHIEKLNETISEYELLKKGMMKKLLTEGIGHIEFKDTEIGRIPKEWEVRKLGEISNFRQGFQISRNSQQTKPFENSIRYLYITDFFSDKNILFVQDKEDYYHIQKNDICIANTGNTCGKSFRGAEGLLSNNMFKIFIEKEKVSEGYYWHYLQSDLYWSQLSKFFNSAGQPHVGHKNMSILRITIPSLAEQQQIASILSSIDERIELYKSEKEDFVQVKKGLMEKLLTGKIRV